MELASGRFQIEGKPKARRIIDVIEQEKETGCLCRATSRVVSKRVIRDNSLNMFESDLLPDQAGQSGFLKQRPAHCERVRSTTNDLFFGIVEGLTESRHEFQRLASVRWAPQCTCDNAGRLPPRRRIYRQCTPGERILPLYAMTGWSGTAAQACRPNARRTSTHAVCASSRKSPRTVARATYSRSRASFSRKGPAR